MRQHNRKNQQFSWKGVDLMEGLAGEWTPAQAADHSTMTAAGHGKMIRHLNENKSGTISYPCLVASQTYRDLAVLQRQDEMLENVIGVGLFEDANLGMAIVYKNMTIVNVPPPPGGGVEASQVTVTFGYESWEYVGPASVPTVGA
jgi:hypothetical protein